MSRAMRSEDDWMVRVGSAGAEMRELLFCENGKSEKWIRGDWLKRHRISTGSSVITVGGG